MWFVGAFSSPRKSPSYRTTHLFGIKGFRSWFEGTFPSAVTTITTTSPDRYRGNRGRKQHNINRNGESGFQPETFDHVLIDANQFLHTTLRKAYNRRKKRDINSHSGQHDEELDEDIIEHVLLLFIKEINRITSTTAVPRRSLVVALGKI